MKNREKFFFSGCFVIILVLWGFFKADNFSNNDLAKIETLEIIIDSMLKHDEGLKNEVKKLCKKEKRLFFWYSNKECNSCIDLALVDLYELSKNSKDKKKK